MKTFYSFDKWVDQQIPILIKQVNETETANGEKEVAFFYQLAAFSLQRNTFRCPCETIVASYTQKVYPNGKAIPTGILAQYAKDFAGKTEDSMRTTFTNLCLQRFPKNCVPRVNPDKIVLE